MTSVPENKKIRLRQLGKTHIQVSPVGLGVMELAGGGGLIGHVFPIIPQEEKNAIIKAALDGGINWFDTAEMYGAGVSEQSLATGLKAAGKNEQDVVIATKWMPFFRTARNIPLSIDTRLGFLDGYRIGNYMIHQPYSFSTPEIEMDAMADLIETGKIQSVGVSNFSADRMRRAFEALKRRGFPLAVNQVRFNLLDRKIEKNGILETAKQLGVTIIAYSPVASGLLTGRYHKHPDLMNNMPAWRKAGIRRNLKRVQPLINCLDEIARKYMATISQVALNWVINFHGDTIITIPGASKAFQAQENAGAMKFRLSDDDMALIDKVSRSL
jgi:aryl-alcohol dehydrogenase-like predicted oxidoreductase